MYKEWIEDAQKIFKNGKKTFILGFLIICSATEIYDSQIYVVSLI